MWPAFSFHSLNQFRLSWTFYNNFIILPQEAATPGDTVGGIGSGLYSTPSLTTKIINFLVKTSQRKGENVQGHDELQKPIDKV